MSKKSRRPTASAASAPAPALKPAQNKSRLVALTAVAGVLVVALVTWLAVGSKTSGRTDAEMAALSRPQASTTGNPAAKVHIVEFLDPACETCREFYPYVKAMMKSSPENIRLSVRMVAFHPNSDVAVKALEASKAQGRFWETLDALLASQPRWVMQHRVDPDRLWEEIGKLDLDLAKLKSDMESSSVLQSVSRDAQDARTLKVTATPEYFVNGRGLPEFGYDQLRRLVDDELAKAKS